MENMVSASQLNTYWFCPRLLFLEGVLGFTGSNIESEEGRFLHDKLASEEVYLSSDALGLHGKVDVLTSENIPIEYKRGKPFNQNTPWEGHAVQCCAMGLLLEHVHQRPVTFGYIWYAGNRQRIKVEFSQELRERTIATLQKARNLLHQTKQLPAPIENLKACMGCNQFNNCLPQECLETEKTNSAKEVQTSKQKVLAPHTEGQPLYIDKPGSKLALKDGKLVLSHWDSEPFSIGLERVNQIIIGGASSCSSALLEACARQDIPVAFLGFNGSYQGSLHNGNGKNVLLRIEQIEQFRNAEKALQFAKVLVKAKVINQRVLLRRHLGPSHEKVRRLKAIIESIERASSAAQLMGIEGDAAKQYFEAFFECVQQEKSGLNWLKRKKHPSPDPLNSLLSFGYSILTQQALAGCHLAGLDPYLGFYHGIKHGKPALALDIMEVFRTPFVDSVVLGFVNRKQCGPEDFEMHGSACIMKESVRKAFVKALFERLREPVKHPVYGYTCSYQRAIHIEARMLGFALLSGQHLWKPFQWR